MRSWKNSTMFQEVGVYKCSACFVISHILELSSEMSNPHADASTTAAQNLGRRESVVDGGLLRRSWHAMSEMINPFSSSALASLPRYPQGLRERSTRADNIPEQGYGAVNLPPGVRVPKKLATPIKVEGKVWLACERSMFPLSINRADC